MATTERDSLELHVDLCHLRYQQLENRVTSLEKKIDSVADEVKAMKADNDQNFEDIKKLLGNAKDEKFKVMVTATGTIIVGLLTVLGYVITHLAK